MLNTDGHALELLIHPADVQDRDGAVSLLRQSRRRHPYVERAFADRCLQPCARCLRHFITIKIFRKFADQTGFLVHPRRWVIERTFAWINRSGG